MSSSLVRFVLIVAALIGAAAISSAAERRLTECEGVLCGGDWHLNGERGSARWPNGSVGELTIERFDADEVVIRRTDSVGASAGLTALYTGKIKDGRVDGKVIYSWPARWREQKVYNWGATLDDQPESTPVPLSASGSLPNLNGMWTALAANGRPMPNLVMALVQNGSALSVVLFLPAPTNLGFSFRGVFTSAKRLWGYTCGPGLHPENPDCTPAATITVVNPTNLRDNTGLALRKIAGPRDPRFAAALALARASEKYLPEAPFDLSGTWQSGEPAGGQMQIVQRDGVVTVAYPGGDPVFAGRYTRNPLVSGTGRGSYANIPKWWPWSIFVDDPDHIHVNVGGAVSHVFFRRSSPAAHDLPCDLQDQFHVSRFYAWMRGSVAWGAHDYTATRCWLTLSAHQGFARGQSLLAAFMIRAPDGSTPDYAAAFRLAAQSARAGDVNGELVLASMFREGKGTLPDPRKAAFWEAQAQQSRELDLWRRLSAKNMFGMSVIDLAVAVTDAVNQGVQMNDAPMFGGSTCNGTITPNQCNAMRSMESNSSQLPPTGIRYIP